MTISRTDTGNTAGIRQAIAEHRLGEALDELIALRSAEPANAEATYLFALVNARLGAVRAAWQALEQLSAVDALPPDNAAEVEALRGRIAKDRFLADPTAADAASMLQQARSAYEKAFTRAGSPFPGINAASLAMLAGDADEARRMARAVRDLLSRDPQPGNHWYHATQGEAALLLDERETALAAYRAARTAAGKRFGDIASMRKQLRMLSRVLPDAGLLRDALPAPAVLAFTGHMIDQPARNNARFPPSLEHTVRTAIDRAIAARPGVIGFASAACGADLLFCEGMIAGGHDLTVVMPFAKHDFVATSVAFAGDVWVERFERVLNSAARVAYASEEPYLGDDVLFEHAANLIQGMAFLRARELETEPEMLAVLDRTAPSVVGGTRSTVERWIADGGRIATIELSELRATHSAQTALPPLKPELTPIVAAQPIWTGARMLKTMLFADVAGFSKLDEAFMPAFFTEFLSLVHTLINKAADPPVKANTWGDGLHLVFNNSQAGARFALNLRDGIRATHWERRGLPGDLGVRIGMHTGPVFETFDPVVGAQNYYGANVTRAARIEPVATPGSIYVSEAFAATLAREAHNRYTCDYVGTIALAKNYRNARIYRLREAGTWE